MAISSTATKGAPNPMSSGQLISSDQDRTEPASAEVEFALVIARMIDSVQSSPDDLRQAIYDLARYKLQEQFTHADAKNIKSSQQALETAIRGVESFSRQHPRPLDRALAPPSGDLAAEMIAEAQPPPQLESRPRAPAIPVSNLQRTRTPDALWSYLRRTAAVMVVLVGVLIAFQQRERLRLMADGLREYAAWQPPVKEQPAIKEPPPAAAQIPGTPPPAAPARPAPLRPTDYGVYAVSDDRLVELKPLPGRPPDIRVAVSAALKIPSQTVLPNGHPRFIVFRRDVASSVADRSEIRIIAKVAREFSAEAAGRKPSDSDDVWVMRNVSFPFRTSPMSDNQEMYDIHSEDPALELPPGRYALVLRTQSYDFSVEGEITDPKQCIERIVATNGTFYSDCKKP